MSHRRRSVGPRWSRRRAPAGLQPARRRRSRCPFLATTAVAARCSVGCADVFVYLLRRSRSRPRFQDSPTRRLPPSQVKPPAAKTSSTRELTLSPSSTCPQHPASQRACLLSLPPVVTRSRANGASRPSRTRGPPQRDRPVASAGRPYRSRLCVRRSPKRAANLARTLRPLVCRRAVSAHARQLSLLVAPRPPSSPVHTPTSPASACTEICNTGGTRRRLRPGRRSGAAPSPRQRPPSLCIPAQGLRSERRPQPGAGDRRDRIADPGWTPAPIAGVEACQAAALSRPDILLATPEQIALLCSTATASVRDARARAR